MPNQLVITHQFSRKEVPISLEKRIQFVPLDNVSKRSTVAASFIYFFRDRRVCQTVIRTSMSRAIWWTFKDPPNMSICTILSIEPLFKATQFDKHQGDYLLKEQPFSNHIYFPNKLCHYSLYTLQPVPLS